MSFSKNLPYNNLPDLPPKGVDLNTPTILNALVKASRRLGVLDGSSTSLPDPDILINTIILQESKESSAIENIVTTQDELYQAASEDAPADASAKEVLNYRRALYQGLDHMRRHENLLLTNTMVEIVQEIKENTAGIRNTPGTGLKNAITGEIVYTPPCCEDVIREKLKRLEEFINDPDQSDLDPLIKMALIHYQFEAIHPFIDGNGRTGRILNTLYLVQQRLLSQPVLYLSSYISHHKMEYYQCLRGVTEKGGWQDWVMYFLTAISETAWLTTTKIRRMLWLMEDMELRLKEILGSSYNPELLKLMFTRPYLKIELLERSKLAHRQTASLWLRNLADAGVLIPKRMGRTIYYINHELMNIITNKNTIMNITINENWTDPLGLEYGKNLRIHAERGNYTVRVFSADGSSVEMPFYTDAIFATIPAELIKNVLRPMIMFKGHTAGENSLHVELYD